MTESRERVSYRFSVIAEFGRPVNLVPVTF
jgi:hypothetical protein